MSISSAFVFNGQHSHLQCAVFSSRYAAERVIIQHQLSGVLTEYPINTLTSKYALKPRGREDSQGYWDDLQVQEQLRQSLNSSNRWRYEGGIRIQ